jgi:hypothetical protein
MTGQLDRGCAVVSLSLLSWSAIGFCHNRLCHNLLQLNWAFPIIWEFMFLQSFFLEPQGILDASRVMETL